MKHFILCDCTYKTPGQNHKFIVNVMEQKGKHILKCQKLFSVCLKVVLNACFLLMWLMYYLSKDIHRRKVWQ